MSSLDQWLRGGEIRDWDRLNERLGELESILREYQIRLSTGPVPGMYFPLQVYRNGTLATGTDLWRFQLPVECRPLMVSVGVSAGEVTVDLNDDGVSALSSPVGTASGVAILRSRTDFATEKIGADSIISLDIDSISGTPRDLYVLFVVKGVGKVEQV